MECRLRIGSRVIRCCVYIYGMHMVMPRGNGPLVKHWILGLMGAVSRWQSGSLTASLCFFLYAFYAVSCNVLVFGC